MQMKDRLIGAGFFSGITIAGGLLFPSGSLMPEKNAKEEKQMNILFLLADDLRWNSLSCMGSELLKTPNIDAIAKDGVKFRNACVTTSISMVSRASILTGQYMSRHKIREFGVPLSQEAFLSAYPSLLREAGYFTGFVGKYGVGKINPKNFDFAREYEGKHWFPDGRGDSVHVTERNLKDALAFLKEKPADVPFALSVSFFAAHAEDAHPDQYRYQPEYKDFYNNDSVKIPKTASDEYLKRLPYFISSELNEGRIRWHWRFDTPEKYQKYMKAYYRLIAGMDDAVGKIVGELKKQGLYENTLIVFMGDNGYFHSEHLLADKWYPYEESVRVPLIVHDPRLTEEKRGIEDNHFVLNIDIAPALISAAGIKVPDKMQGKDFSILYLDNGIKTWRKDFYYEHPFVTNEARIPSSEAVITHTSKYIFWPHYKYEEFFDLLKDRNEVKNLISDPEYKKEISKLKKRLLVLREEAR